ncbi:Aste57867_5091 [Aphanomyces stellatus]|uniref:Aste57867_5091 protein n=1 Tax=Aphanomyces stellatus TaxID=120398 RepID=A0A485KH89_9STRA|nr:hypothetical protein As57867_005078 [Aphanomyces stellatus]VFT82172.1 Aste57867_5091 [Aphanomyces stellatus]
MEKEVDHVRVLNRGLLQYFPSQGVDERSDAARASLLDKTNPQCVVHSSRYGVTVVSALEGLGVTRFTSLEAASNTSIERKDSNLDPLVPLPYDALVELPTAPSLLSLSPSEKLVAVSFDSTLAIYELTRLADPNGDAKPMCLCNGADALALSWCAERDADDDDLWVAVLTSSRQIHVYNMQGGLDCVEGSIEATAHCWAPSGNVLAVGDDEGVIHKLEYDDGAFTEIGTWVNPDNADNAPVHHINWAEDDLVLAGYKFGDIDDVQATACVFDGDVSVPLDAVVDFYPSETRDHSFYSCYLAPWRMFFVGCSLSTDIELLVSDPESGEWEKWKPEEKFTPRLPMTADDEDTFPVGMALVLNSTTDIPGDDIQYFPCPLVLCATTDGKLLNFALLDTTVGEPLDFLVAAPLELAAAARATVDVPALSAVPSIPAATASVVFGVSSTAPAFTFEPEEVAPASSTFGQDTDNVFIEDDDAEDEDDEAERREEEEKASAAFDQVDTRGKGSIPLTDFEKLFDALGTVYSAEEHTKTIRKLDRHGVVFKSDFVAWYLGWIFADDDDDEGEDEDAHGAPDLDPNAAMVSDAERKAAFARFAPAAGSWKCDACFVNNPDAKADKCISCGTANPNATCTAAPAPAAGFGAFATKSGAAPSFSFGVPAQATPSFGVPATPSPSFSFGVPVQPAPTAAPKSTANATTDNTDNVFNDEDDDDDDDDEEERREEEEKANAAFDSVDTDGTGSIPLSDFEKLFKALGTCYSADEHSKTIHKLDRQGVVHKADFVAWYLNWIFADDDEDDDDEANDYDAAPDLDPNAAMVSEAERKAAFARFAPAAGSWKCDVCFVNNPDATAAKCISCDSPNPKAPAEAPTSADAPTPGFGAGFSFGVPALSATTAPAAGFGFGVATTSPSGISFGVPTPTVVPAAKSTFSFGVPGEASKLPSFSFGVKQDQPAPTAAPKSTANATTDNTDNVFNDEDDDEDDEEEERREEEEKANAAFDSVDTDGTGSIPLSDFEKLFKALGTCYSADEHSKTIRKLDRQGVVHKADFVAWYLNWIFADDDEDDEDEANDDDAAPDLDPNAAMVSEAERKAVFARFAPAAGSWKCDACFVNNPDAKAAKCISCGTANPKAPASTAEETTKPATAGFGSAGFSFGVPAGAATGFSASTPAGFGFGVKSTDATPTTNSFSAISFGAGNAFPSTPTKGFTIPVPTTAAAKPANPVAKSSSSAYPPDTSSKPAVAFGSTVAAPKATSAYPPDTSSKPAVVFGVTAPAPKAASAYPSDTSSKPAVAFGVTSTTPAGGFIFPVPAKPATPKASSAYPPDTSAKPAVAFGASAPATGGFNFAAAAKPTAPKTSSAYPPDTSSKPAVAFGSTVAPPKASSAYPPDTSAKPAVAFGATAAATTPKGSSAYPPDTSAKPAVAFGASAPATGGFTFAAAAAKPATPKASTAYPPDTSAKPAVAFGASAPATGGFNFAAAAAKPATPKASTAYPPDTSAKPAVAFGASAPATGGFNFAAVAAKPVTPKASTAYPPDTSAKPAVAFGASAPATGGFNFAAAAAKPVTPKASSSYPPDTSAKPAVAFGSTVASTPKASSAYPPDTSTKPAVSFGATTSSPATGGFTFPVAAKPAPGVSTTKASSAYPPDTSAKPAVTFGATAAAPKASSAYPPDTSSKPAAVFGASTGGLSFGATTSAAPMATSAYPPDTSAKPAVAFGAKASPAYPPDTSAKPTLRFGSASTAAAPKAAPLSFAATPASVKPAAKLDANTIMLQKALPATDLEGEMWKLINVFDRTFQKIRRDDDQFVAQKGQTEAPFEKTLRELRDKVVALCGTVDSLNDAYEKIEKDVQVIVGNGSDVEVQLDCANNLLKAMNDKNIVAHLEDQPLDQRSQKTRESLREQLEAINRFSAELEKHVKALKTCSGAAASPASSVNDTAQLFRVLKMNYETSKREYTRVLDLADQFKQLDMKNQLRAQAPKTNAPIPTKELLKQLRQDDDARRTFKANMHKWTSQPIAPREVSAAVRRQPRRETIAVSKPAPEVPARATSKLMFGAKTTIPSQSAEPAGGLSFQPVTMKLKPDAKPLDAMSLDKPATTTGKSVSFSASTKPGATASGFAFKQTTPAANSKPMSSLNSLSFGSKFEDKDDDSVSSPRARKMSTGSKNGTPDKSTGFNFPVATAAKASAPKVGSTVKALDFGAKPKDSSNTASVTPAAATPAFLFKPTSDKPPMTATTLTATPAAAVNFTDRIKSFYATYAPGKDTAAAEKLIVKNKGKEEEVFQKLLAKYVSDKATLEHAKQYIATGVVPEAIKNGTPSASATVATTTPATVPAFGAKPPTAPVAAASPFGAFGTTAAPPTAAKPSPFGAATPPAAAASPFGTAAPVAAAASPFGSAAPAAAAAASPFASTTPAWGSSSAQPAAAFGASPAFGGVDYRAKVVEFYKQHNPDKLSEVDTVLAKYKGKEEELLQKLEAKYNKPKATGFGAQSPFGAAAAPAFGSTPSPFGASPSAFGGNAAASPFGAAAAAPAFGSNPSPFGAAPPAAAAGGFGSASPFGAPPASQVPAFGSTTGFSSTTAAPAFGSTTQLGGFGGLGASAPTFGASSTLGGGAAASGGGFSSFASGATPSFGGGFGGQAAAAATPAFGGGGGFGQPSGFGNPSFTQARR